jgi:hypothetical protein
MATELKIEKVRASKAIKKGKRLGQPKHTKLTKFMFEHALYSLGDFLLLRETNKTTAVGRLVAIIPNVVQKNGQVLPMLKIKWFYQKKDIISLA